LIGVFAGEIERECRIQGSMFDALSVDVVIES
jgi:hypothetical protein